MPLLKFDLDRFWFLTSEIFEFTENITVKSFEKLFKGLCESISKRSFDKGASYNTLLKFRRRPVTHCSRMTVKILRDFPFYESYKKYITELLDAGER